MRKMTEADFFQGWNLNFASCFRQRLPDDESSGREAQAN
jgi:hypothetical protein